MHLERLKFVYFRHEILNSDQVENCQKGWKTADKRSRYEGKSLIKKNTKFLKVNFRKHRVSLQITPGVTKSDTGCHLHPARSGRSSRGGWRCWVPDLSWEADSAPSLP